MILLTAVIVRTDTAVRTITAPTIAIFSGISKHEADPNKRGQES